MSQAFIIQHNVEWLSWLHIHRLLMFLFTDWFAVVSSLSQIRSRIFSKAKLSSTVTVRKCHGKLWLFRRKTRHYWHVFSCDIFFNQRDEQKKIILNWLLILCKCNNLCYLSCLDFKNLRKLQNCPLLSRSESVTVKCDTLDISSRINTPNTIFRYTLFFKNNFFKNTSFGFFRS